MVHACWRLPAQRLLNNASRSLTYEVMNFGVNGYSLHQQVEALMAKGLPFSPDLVIFGYVMNDPKLSNRLIDDITYSPVKSIGFLVWKFKAARRNLRGIKVLLRQLYHPDSKEWRSLVDSLDELERLAGEKNFKVIFAVFPLVPGKDKIPNPLLTSEHLLVREELARHGFLVVDLFEPFNAAGFKAIRYWPGDPYHYNPQGYALAAGEIFRAGQRAQYY